MGLRKDTPYLLNMCELWEVVMEENYSGVAELDCIK